MFLNEYYLFTLLSRIEPLLSQYKTVQSLFDGGLNVDIGLCPSVLGSIETGALVVLSLVNRLNYEGVYYTWRANLGEAKPSILQNRL